jgi:signal transduction histidine kinase
LLAGFAFWAYTLFLPSFGGEVLLSADVLRDGPWGIAILRPQSLFGLVGMDPLVHAVVWSVGGNALTFVVVSSLSHASALERLQSTLFVDVFKSTGGEPSSVAVGTAEADDLLILARRILGDAPATRLFEELARSQGLTDGLPEPTDSVIARLERELAGSIGAASAHALVTRIAGRQPLGMTDLIEIADETQQLMETTRQLAEKSEELEETAHQLRRLNERLRSLDAQKDAFLSQVSPELRTPMTSIRSFSEILLDGEAVSRPERERFLGIINAESRRLTRLLDELLDMNRLEAGTSDMHLEPLDLAECVTGAVETMSGVTQDAGMAIRVEIGPEAMPIAGNADRVRQILINLISNAAKYNNAGSPRVDMRARQSGDRILLDIIDNGGGITRREATTVFEKFARGDRSDRSQGAGLGLPISRAIMRAMDGDLTVEFRPDGSSFFRLTFKLARGPVSSPE